MGCYSPLKGWKDRDTGGLTFRRENAISTMEVACGQCLGCRLDHSRMWAMRIVHEASLYEYSGGNCFITLTYRDELEATKEQRQKGQYIPDDWSLHKSHLQRFLKRLRWHFRPKKIRFYAAGEYGSTCKHGLKLDWVSCPCCNVGRPHYHVCLFNCTFNDLESYSGDGQGGLRYTSKTLERIWGFGFVDVGELNFDTAAYVSRYILKKITGERAKDHYWSNEFDGTSNKILPEFTVMSRRPGIGKEWFEKYKEDVFPSDEVPVPGAGVYQTVPRYYEEIFKCEDAVSMEEIKAIRRKYKEEHPEEFTAERLMAKYKVTKANKELFGSKDKL